MTNLIILGAGNVARELIGIVADLNDYCSLSGRGMQFRIVFLAEDGVAAPGRRLAGVDVISSEDVLRMDSVAVHLVCAAGDPARATWVARYEIAGFRFATIVHPSAVVSKDAVVGSGSIVYPGSFISCGATIGNHVLVQPNCSLMHDVEIGDCSTLCPGVHIGGYTKIGAASFIGIGATISDRVTIGEGVTVGAGTAVIDDIPPGVVAAGSPARVLRRKIS